MGFKQILGILTAVICLVSARPASADTIRIVGFGDSLMAGYMLAPGESLPERLEQALVAAGHDVVISNAGVSGDTTSGGLARLDWSVPEETDIVILELGANDMLRGIAPDIAEANLREIVERLQARSVDIVLLGMLAAPSLGADYGQAFDAIYPRLAEDYELPFYPFVLDGVAANPELLLDDGMHPNRAGVERMVDGVLPLMTGMLEARAASD